MFGESVLKPRWDLDLVALLRDGKLLFMLERGDIEGRDAYSIAEDLTNAFDRFCVPASSAASA